MLDFGVIILSNEWYWLLWLWCFFVVVVVVVVLVVGVVSFQLLGKLMPRRSYHSKTGGFNSDRFCRRLDDSGTVARLVDVFPRSRARPD